MAKHSLKQHLYTSLLWLDHAKSFILSLFFLKCMFTKCDHVIYLQNCLLKPVKFVTMNFEPTTVMREASRTRKSISPIRIEFMKFR